MKKDLDTPVIDVTKRKSCYLTTTEIYANSTMLQKRQRRSRLKLRIFEKSTILSQTFWFKVNKKSADFCLYARRLSNSRVLSLANSRNYLWSSKPALYNTTNQRGGQGVGEPPRSWSGLVEHPFNYNYLGQAAELGNGGQLPQHSLFSRITVCMMSCFTVFTLVLMRFFITVISVETGLEGPTSSP